MTTGARARASKRLRPGRKDKLNLQHTATKTILPATTPMRPGTSASGLPEARLPIASEIRAQGVRVEATATGPSPMLRRPERGMHSSAARRRLPPRGFFPNQLASAFGLTRERLGKGPRQDTGRRKRPK